MDRHLKGVSGKYSTPQLRRPQKFNRVQLEACATNRKRRQPMFEAMEDKAVATSHRHRDDYLNQRYNHGPARSFNGARKP